MPPAIPKTYSPYGGPVFGRGYTAQKGARILIDDNFVNFFKVNPLKKRAFMREVERGFRRAAVVGANAIKTQISSMRAVAAGFMRKSVTYEVDVNSERKQMIILTFGTKAWYDILVHEGLGRHGGQRTIPAQYKPTPEQLAIVEPSPEERMRLPIWKPSPKGPRPFLILGIRRAKKGIRSEIVAGMIRGIKAMKGKGATPKHDISVLLGGGRF